MSSVLQKILAIVALLATWPIFLLVWLAIKLEDGGLPFFRQERIGKGKKPFTMYKFRTMISGAENLKKKLLHLNEADGPVFKIRDDPRYTRVGKFLAHTGFDELPQLINIIKGEMAFVGPRPLPDDEAKKVPKKYEKRFLILPGITSLWVVKGAHGLSFDEWMRLDLKYVRERAFLLDVGIFWQTLVLIVRSIALKFWRRSG